MKQHCRRMYQFLVFLVFLFLLMPSVAMSETDVTDQVTLRQTRMYYLLNGQTCFFGVRNTSDRVLQTPIKVVIDDISPKGVKVLNPDGIMDDGKPYLEYTTRNGELLPGQSTYMKKVYFSNPIYTNVRIPEYHWLYPFLSRFQMVNVNYYPLRFQRVNIRYTTVILASSDAETINGIIVPPAPDEAINNSTIEGVDSNNNDLRDDVERFIAEEYGADAIMYEEVKIHVITLQIALRNPNSETISDHLDSFRCINDYETLEELDRITTAMLNTRQRMGAYGKTFAGVLISDEGCQNEND